jgi:alginate O-acetyltransferase complex protein AlgI
VLGYLFKTVIADPCATVADPVFADPEKADSLTIYCASLAFLAQLYMDFLGYTHIARGVSLLFNIELPLNFDHPFQANSVANFWQRWHISLSRWLRDYLYLPLGGTRKSLLLTMGGVFFTFLIAGIWHGAGWNYIIFGISFGLIISCYHAYIRCRDVLLKTMPSVIDNSVYKALGHLITFWLVLLAFVPFRAPNLHTTRIFGDRLLNVSSLIHDVAARVMARDFVDIATCLICLIVLLSGPIVVHIYQQLFTPTPHWVKVQMASVAVVLCWIMCSAPLKQFIYFQF